MPHGLLRVYWEQGFFFFLKPQCLVGRRNLIHSLVKEERRGGEDDTQAFSAAPLSVLTAQAPRTLGSGLSAHPASACHLRAASPPAPGSDSPPSPFPPEACALCLIYGKIKQGVETHGKTPKTNIKKREMKPVKSLSLIQRAFFFPQGKKELKCHRNRERKWRAFPVASEESHHPLHDYGHR